MEVVTTVIKVTTTGSAGSATGSATSGAVIPGFLVDIMFDFHASAPATTDVTVSYAARGGNLLVASNSATDVLYQPLKQTVDAAGAAITGVYGQYLLDDKITVAVAQSDALTDAVVVYIRSMVP